jgi:hypothetical protein
MAETNQALAYIALNASRAVPLTWLRITTLLYLSDWRSAIIFKKQISDVNWVQPFVEKVPDIAHRITQPHSGFVVEEPGVIRFAGPPRITLSPDAAECIDFVLHGELQKGWLEFFRIAYSTFPMFSQPARAALDLVDLARRYEQHSIIEHVG